RKDLLHRWRRALLAKLLVACAAHEVPLASQPFDLEDLPEELHDLDRDRVVELDELATTVHVAAAPRAPIRRRDLVVARVRDDDQRPLTLAQDPHRSLTASVGAVDVDHAQLAREGPDVTELLDALHLE